MPTRYLAYLLPLLLSSCGGPAPPELSLKVANPLEAGGSCPGTDSAFTTLQSPNTVRVTARVHAADDRTKSVRLCDTVFAGSDRPTFAVAIGGDSRVDLFAEAFDKEGIRIATGALLDVDPRNAPSCGSDKRCFPNLRLFKPEQFHCNPSGGLGKPRAFHTATTLANGHILFIGGATPLPDDSEGPAGANDELYLTGKIEIFDPVSETFTTLKEAAEPTTRAFHSAVALRVDDEKSHKYKVLLVGGLSTGASTTTVAMQRNQNGLVGFRFLVTPAVLAAPAEIITYDADAKAIIDRKPAPGVHSAAFMAGAAFPNPRGGTLPSKSGGGVFAGGFRAPGNGMTPMPDAHLDATNDGTPRGAALKAPRVAAGLATLSDKQALLVGGPSDGMEPPFELLTTLDTAPVATSVESKPMMELPALWFPTLVALPPSRVLVAGGLQVAFQNDPMLVFGPIATQPPDANSGLFIVSTIGGAELPVAKVTASATSPTYLDSTCGAKDHYRSAAWNAATVLLSGDRVLLTGGTPRLCDCEGTEMGLTCALQQVAIFDTRTEKLAPLFPFGQGGESGKLQIPRFGHTHSLLPDGKVLIAGGLTRNQSKTRGVKAVEVWNPARRTPVLIDAGMNRMVDPDDPVLSDLTSADSADFAEIAREAVKTGVAGGQFYRGASKAPALPCGAPM
ncbi:MAG: hypothetical protein EXR72_27075 [Myxococcales bacterium]|nr:hypothetical protein [Myxococcales bacterium]